MDASSEELLGDMTNAINFDFSQEIEISQKSKTFYSERKNNVQNGTRQQITCVSPPQKHKLF